MIQGAKDETQCPELSEKGQKALKNYLANFKISD
jgi:hypothetical protein